MTTGHERERRYDAALARIADSLGQDDPRLAKRLAAGPLGPLRRLRRLATALVVSAATGVCVSALFGGPGAVIASAGVGLVALFVVIGTTIVMRAAEGPPPARPAWSDGDDLV